MSLATKYRPKSFDDVVEQPIIVDCLRNMCSADTLENRNMLLVGPAGTGKAQPMYSKVLTPDGFIEMRDVNVGTKVITASGHIASVSGVYPQGVRPIYEITLSDRTKIRVSDEHLNVVYRYNKDKKKIENFTLTTMELIKLHKESRFKLRIGIPTLDCWQNDDLPIDPYLLGALLGDGTLGSGNIKFSNVEPDVLSKIDSILSRDWNRTLKRVNRSNCDYNIVSLYPCKYILKYKGVTYYGAGSLADYLRHNGYPNVHGDTIIDVLINKKPTFMYYDLKHEIEVTVCNEYENCDRLKMCIKSLNLNVSGTSKHIPKQFLLSSYDSRWKLLQGLFDTDGYISKEGVPTFTTCSKQLSDDFAFLVRSLGIRDTISESPSKYTINGCVRYTGETVYDHQLKVKNGNYIFSSDKHKARYRDRQHDPIRNIVSIEYIGDEECQCIYVDHEDHTYISDDFIPTHNTTLGRLIGNALNGCETDVIELDAASNNGVENMRDIVSQAKTFPIGMKYKTFLIDEAHALSNAAWQSLLKVLEESPARSVFIFCTTNPEKIPPTIISRLQVFRLSKISLDGIFNRLKYILDTEKIQYDEDAVMLIAKLSCGGMRDAITMLDKSLSYSQEITSKSVELALNLPNYNDFFDLLGAYAKHDNAKVTSILDTIYNSDSNFINWIEAFQAFVTNVMKYVYLRDINRTSIPAHYNDKLSAYSEAHAFVCLKLSNVLLQMIKDIKDSRYQLEIALSYLCCVTKKGGASNA